MKNRSCYYRFRASGVTFQTICIIRLSIFKSQKLATVPKNKFLSIRKYFEIFVKCFCCASLKNKNVLKGLKINIMKKIILFLTISFTLLIVNADAQINRQEQTMWCWASCIQSCLYQANVNQSQSTIVSRLTGWPQNKPATINEVISVLHSYNFRSWSVGHPASPQQLFNTLSSGWKLIAFVNPSNNQSIGHFIILQGISRNGFIIVSDPADGRTYEQDVRSLYYGWKWSGSIVVGTPS